MSIRKRTNGIRRAGGSLRGGLSRWRRAIVALMIALTAGAALYGLHLYRSRLAGGEGYCIRSSDLRLVEGTAWMTPDIVNQVRSSLAELPPRLSVMDPASAGHVARCLEGNPWVREVSYVRLDRPQAGSRSNGLEVAMVFRRPVAFVEAGRGADARYYLVDRDGVRLSDRPYTEPLLGDRVLLTVGGVRSPAPAAGEVWDDPAVLAAAEVANIVRHRVGKYNLSRIDVVARSSGEDRCDPEIVLYTKRRQTCIVWGGRPSRRSEVLEGWTASQKLEYLDGLVERLDGLDGRVERVDFVEGQLRLHRPAFRRGRSIQG